MIEDRIKLRDLIIFNEQETMEPGFGIRRFQNLDPSRLNELVSEHLADLTVTQNESPDIKRFLRYGFDDNEGLKRTIYYEGYVYTDVTSEYSLSPTIDGIREVCEDTDIDHICEFVEAFHNADDFQMRHCGNQVFMKAWWD